MGERMKKFFISLIAGLLGVSAAIGTSSIYAAETRMQIEASMEEPIQISANEEGYDGDLHIEVENSYEIERDYDQNLMLTVTNISDQARAYYMAVDHSYADLSVNFIKGGSQSEPLLIEPGESQQVQLAIFAQNAEQERYGLPVEARLADTAETDARAIVHLRCDIPQLDVSCQKLRSESSTLISVYELINTGEALSDVTVRLSGDAAAYVRTDPIISNLAMESHERREFRIIPDLAKMKQDGITRVSGEILVESGAQCERFALNIDTEGKEIHLISVKDLLLKQDGNPYYNLNVVDDSLDHSESVDGEAVRTDTAVSFTYGENGEEQLDLSVQTALQPYTGAQEDAEPVCELIEDGAGTALAHVRVYLTEEQYRQIAADAQSDPFAFRRLLRDSPQDDAANYVFDVYVAVGETIDDTNTFKTIGNFSTAYSIGSDIVGLADVSCDPTYSEAQRNTYAALTGATIALSLAGIVLPGVGTAIALSTGSFLLNLWKSYIESHPAGALNMYMEGFQCTNRGRIDNSFYLPDYADGTKPDLHYTGRMYDQKDEDFSHHMDTSYDYYLNGDHAGQGHNDGLSDLAMDKIDNSSLNVGDQNTLVRDYDTDAGHYFISTENELTALYPPESLIGYIGDPQELEDMRTKPDFAVYHENIIVKGNDPIIDEKTQLTFKVYNRGSRGGWYDVLVYDGDKLLMEKQNEALNAFSSTSYTIDWTPGSRQHDIRVVLRNATIGVEERSSSNNEAVRHLQARSREIPQITQLNVSDDKNGRNVSFSADIQSYADVSAVQFLVDGTPLQGSVHSGTYAKTRRFWSDGISLDQGEHELSVIVTYAIQSGEKTIRMDKPFTVEARTYAVPEIKSAEHGTLFALQEQECQIRIANASDVISVEVESAGKARPASTSNTLDERIYQSAVRFAEAGQQQIIVRVTYAVSAAQTKTIEKQFSAEVLPAEEAYYRLQISDELSDPLILVDGSAVDHDRSGSGEYLIRWSEEAYADPQLHLIQVVSGNAMITRTMDDSNHSFSLDDCAKITLYGDEGFALDEVSVRSVNGIGTYQDLNSDGVLYLSDGLYTLDVTYECYETFRSDTLQFDVTGEDLSMDLTAEMKQYSFQLKDPAPYASAYMFCYDEANDYWQSCDLQTRYHEESGLLNCVLTNDYDLQLSENASQLCFVIYTEDHLYLYVVNNRQRIAYDTIMLSDEGMNKVEFTPADAGVQVNGVDIEIFGYTVPLHASTIYVPEGNYEMTVRCLHGDDEYISKQLDVEVSGDQQVDVGFDLTGVRVNWPASWGTEGVLTLTSREGGSFSHYAYIRNTLTSVEKGSYDMNLSLYGDTSYSFHRLISAKDQEVDIDILDSFSGVLENNSWTDTFTGYERISLSLSDLKDRNGNTLTYFSVDDEDDAFRGYVIFTNVEDEREVYRVPITLSDSSSFDVEVPNVEGTFHVSLSIQQQSAASAADKAALAAQVEEDLKIKNEGYTKQSWAHFQEALAHAQSILNDDSATQQEIEAALLRLNEARAALQKIEGTMTEKEQLEQAFSHAQSIRNEHYTDDSWNAFQQALRDAKAVLADPDSDAQDYESALRALQDAIAALRVQQPDDAEDTDTAARQNTWLWISVMGAAGALSMILKKRRKA